MHNHYARSEAKAAGKSKYYGGKPCKFGHDGRWVVNGKCVTCDAARVKKARKLPPDVARERNQKFYYRDIEKTRALARESYARNVERNRKRALAYYEKHKDEKNAYSREYQKKPETVEARRARVSSKFKNDPAALLHRRIRSQVRYFLRRWVDGKSATATVKLLPYSSEQLARHIEKQFLPGMGWDNTQLWHVDHIIPLASFSCSDNDLSGVLHAWEITNLRPLWAEDNRRKWAHRTLLM